MTILELENLCKSFGGLQAVDGVSLKIEQGDFRAIIGPNGAGKTTLFNVITKYLKPDSGRIFFQGTDITRLNTREITRMGIGRSFQLANVYLGLSVLENIQFAFMCCKRRNSTFFSPATKMFTEEAAEIASALGIGAQLNSKASALPHGDKRRLDIALVLAQEPRLILLDEPTSGLSPKERSVMFELLAKIAKERELTTVIIEHDLDIAFKADAISVLHQGRLIAEGKPEEIKRNEEVQRVYLGG